MQSPTIRWRRAYNKMIVLSKLKGGERMPLVPYAKLAVWRREAERLRVTTRLLSIYMRANLNTLQNASNAHQEENSRR